jgi:hypothetical protein
VALPIYLHRQDYDSAMGVFKYVNYAFAPKDEGTDIPIGSNIQVSVYEKLLAMSTPATLPKNIFV